MVCEGLARMGGQEGIDIRTWLVRSVSLQGDTPVHGLSEACGGDTRTWYGRGSLREHKHLIEDKSSVQTFCLRGVSWGTPWHFV